MKTIRWWPPLVVLACNLALTANAVHFLHKSNQTLIEAKETYQRASAVADRAKALIEANCPSGELNRRVADNKRPVIIVSAVSR